MCELAPVHEQPDVPGSRVQMLRGAAVIEQRVHLFPSKRRVFSVHVWHAARKGSVEFPLRPGRRIAVSGSSADRA